MQPIVPQLWKTNKGRLRGRGRFTPSCFEEKETAKAVFPWQAIKIHNFYYSPHVKWLTSPWDGGVGGGGARGGKLTLLAEKGFHFSTSSDTAPSEPKLVGSGDITTSK